MLVRMMLLALVCFAFPVLPGCEQASKENNAAKPSAVVAKTAPEGPAGTENKPATSAAPSETPDGAAAAKTDSQGKQADVTKLEITELKEGTGTEAQPGKSVSVHYRGTLTDGTEFDSSRKHGAPFEFPLGAGQVIRGWDEGVKGMKVGGKRKLVIPPDMGYGPAGAGGVIPPNATLIFEVELLDVK